MNMRTEPNRPYLFRFTSTDGLRIACARWDSPGPVLGIVQIAHGLGEYIGRYAGLIDGLALSGSGVLDGLVRLAQSSQRAPAEIVNAAFEPARTPCDWISRD